MSEVLCPYCGGEMRRVMTIWSDGEWYECKDCGSRSPLVRPMNYDDALKTALVRADSPVVRCRECKKCRKRESKLGIHWCNQWDNVVRDKDFCSFGERKADGGAEG